MGSSWHRALTIDVIGNQQEGAWRTAGDTVYVQTRDLFTANTLTLVREGDALRGSGEGTTDVLEKVGDGYEPRRDRWRAELVGVSCLTVPRSRAS